MAQSIQATDTVQIPMMQEFLRKLIHISSLWMPILYIYSQRRTMLWILGTMVFLALLIEFLRRRWAAAEGLIQRFFGGMLREHEADSSRAKLTGATYVLISALLCVVIFPKIIAINAFAVLIVSDTAAALFGRRFGKHRFLDKSLEGSAAFVVFGVVVTLCVAAVFGASWRYVAVGAVASVVAAVAEALSTGARIDDNFTIPTSFGFVMWGIFALVNITEFIRLLVIS